MTSISSATSAQSYSPLQRLQDELAAEVSSGTVSSGDQSALSSALTDIDNAMKSGASSSGGTPPSPDAMKSKIDSLIAGEVKDGKLTQAQADELKNVFAQAFAGGPGGAGGADGGKGAGGPPAGGGGGGGASKTSAGPADTNSDGTITAAEQAAYDAKNATSSDSTGSSTKSDTDKLVQDFLNLLKDLQSGSSSSSSRYGSTGDSLAAQIQSLIVNYQA